MSITAYHAKYYAYELTKRHADRGLIAYRSLCLMPVWI